MFDLLSYILLLSPHPHIIPIHPDIPHHFTPLPSPHTHTYTHLSGMIPEIHHLPIEQGGCEELAELLCHLEIIGWGLSGLLDTNA